MLNKCSSHFIKVLFVAINVPLRLIAQCDFEKQKEIKLSGNYYYGEAINTDKEQAHIDSRTEMITKIASLYNEKQIANYPYDSIMYVRNIAYCEIPYAQKIKCIAYVPINKVSLNNEPDSNKEFKVVKIEYSDTKNNTVNKSKIVPNGNINERSQENFLSQNNIIDSLNACRYVDDVERFLINQSHKNKLEFTSKESLVVDEADCYILVIDKTSHKILACLGKGTNSRSNLYDKVEVKDYKNTFNNANFIWVHVY